MEMRCTVGDLAQARNRILANDPELAAHVRKLADARRKPSWLSEAVEGLRDISQPPAAEAAARGSFQECGNDFEVGLLVKTLARRWMVDSSAR